MIINFLQFVGAHSPSHFVIPLIQTSALSKTWKQARHRFPFLVFDSRSLHRVTVHCEKGKEAQILKVMLWDVFNYMEETLHCRQKEMIGITSFILDVISIATPFWGFESFIDQWVCYEIESDVKWIWNLSSTLGKTVEQVACSLKLLTILALNGCKLELWASSLFPSLRQLHLSSANTDDHVVKNLLGGCALLEVIIFYDCSGLKSLELAGLSNWDQDMEQLSWS